MSPAKKTAKKQAVSTKIFDESSVQLLRTVEKPEDPERRAAMQLLINVAGGVFVTKVAPLLPPYPKEDGSRSTLVGLKSVAPDTGKSAMADPKSLLSYQLFLLAQSPVNDFLPPQHWKHPDGGISPPDIVLPSGQKTYGHESEVLKKISTFLTGTLGIEWIGADSGPKASIEHATILLGSGASNQETEQILGIPESPRFTNSVCQLHYSIGQESTRLRRWQYGKWTEPFTHTVCRREDHKILRPDSRAGEQTSDYLLVTRLPGEKPRTTTTILAGLHGPGTRSAERLFTSIRFRDLLQLGEILNLKPTEVPHYQAVFKCTDFQRHLDEDPTDSDVATNLELVTSYEFRPRRLDL
jgi:hypothetical protein